MFSLRKKTDYALTTVYLLSKKTDKYIPLRYLIDKTNMPKRFLARITATLTKHNILESKEGRSGGYKLAKDLKDISLYQFLRIFEEDIKFLDCQDPKFKSNCRNICKHGWFFTNKLTNLISKELKKVTLEDIFETKTSFK